MSITIKKMETEQEKRGKAYVQWKSWQETYTGLVDQRFLDELTLEKCEEITSAYPAGVLVAIDGERVVGFIGIGPCRHADLSGAGEVYAIYLLRDYHGRGIGKELMRAGLEELKAFSRVAVTVLKNNKKAIRFYECCGFCTDGCEQEILLGSPITEIRMIKARN